MIIKKSVIGIGGSVMSGLFALGGVIKKNLTAGARLETSFTDFKETTENNFKGFEKKLDEHEAHDENRHKELKQIVSDNSKRVDDIYKILISAK